MPVHPDDIVGQNLLLDTMNTGEAFELALLTGDPRAGGVEVSYPGYARVTGLVDDATFWTTPAADGIREAAEQTFPESTDEGGTATFWARYRGGVLWDFDELEEDIEINSAGVVPTVSVRTSFAAVS